MRAQKNTNKKVWKALKKAGLQDTPQGIKAHKEYLSTMRQLNKQRKVLEKEKAARKKIKTERNFKDNPAKFAQKLFEGEKKNGAPVFGAEEAENYFQTYMQILA